VKDYQSLRRVRELFLKKLLAEEPNHPWGAPVADEAGGGAVTGEA